MAKLHAVTGLSAAHAGNRKEQEMAITPTAVDIGLTKRKSSGMGGSQMPLQMSLSGRISPMDAMASTPSQFRCAWCVYVRDDLGRLAGSIPSPSDMLVKRQHCIWDGTGRPSLG
jgi:hypothetical protein